ncbi:MAG: hypothetical protein HEP71_18490 [Roseivirga sp.]|nr:hypothetical protein [Roseivirga sp.]
MQIKIYTFHGIQSIVRSHLLRPFHEFFADLKKSLPKNAGIRRELSE